MAFDSGFLDERIQIWNPSEATIGKHGVKEKGDFELVGTVWASCTYAKGMRNLNNGSVEAYDYYMVRCRYNPDIKPSTHIKWQGKEFQMDGTPKGKYSTNETQFVMVEIVK